MPEIGELLDADARARLLNAAMHPTVPLAQPKVTAPPKPVTLPPPPKVKHPRQCTCERRHDGFTRDGDLLLHKACGRPLPEASILRGASAVPVVMPCAGGCGANVTMAVRKRDLPYPRIASCVDCAQALVTGPVTILSRPKSAAPIGVTTNQEKPLPKTVNINHIPDAQLGAAIKEAERARLAAEMPAKVKKSKAKKAKRDKAQVKAKRDERADLTAIGLLPAFTLHGVEVPALDVSALANLDELPSSKVRSPYNKVRYRMGEALLPTQDEPGIGVERCTWATLIDEHQRLTPLAGEPKAQISAPIDLDEKAKVKKLREVLGCTKAEARAILATV